MTDSERIYLVGYLEAALEAKDSVLRDCLIPHLIRAIKDGTIDRNMRDWDESFVGSETTKQTEPSNIK